MDTLSNYASNRGTEEYPNASARNRTISLLHQQGFRLVTQDTLLRMTYRLFEKQDTSFSPPARRYCVQWRGKMD